MGACNSVVWFWGGESQRSKLISFRANSAKAHCTGKSSYLEPNSGLFHVPIEEVYRITEKTEGRVAIGEKTAQNHVENTARTYLERIRNGMQKPIEGLSSRSFGALNKGAIVSHEHNSHRPHSLTSKTETPSQRFYAPSKLLR